MKTPIIATTGMLLMLVAVVAPPDAAAHDNRGGACNATTRAAYSACLFSTLDTYQLGVGKCRNEADSADRDVCLDDARDALQEENALCRDQREARDDLCDALGQAPYDPRFESGDFVDPREIGRSIAPNPWFPLKAGRTLVYESKDETVTVTITDEVKVIDKVPCLVVRDVVEVDGELLEDTTDWFAQDVRGNVWYCGEATAEYEGGIPVNVDGSFQADVDGARPGMIMKAAPAVGDVYRQEFDLGNAEDVAKVVGLNGSATVPAGRCAGNCLVTEEFTPLSPGATENKYYQPGVGLILQTKPGSSDRLQLVKIIDR